MVKENKTLERDIVKTTLTYSSMSNTTNSTQYQGAKTDNEKPISHVTLKELFSEDKAMDSF